MKRIYEISGGELLRAVYEWLVANGHEQAQFPCRVKLTADVSPFSGSLDNITVVVEQEP